MFGLFKKKDFPPILNEHMYPTDAKVSAADAKKVVEVFLTKIKYAKSPVIGVLVKNFAQELKEHGEFLREGLADDKGELASLKQELAQLKAELKNASEEVKSGLVEKIEERKEDIESLREEVESQSAENKAFRESKREFTLNYINTLVHGENWRSKNA